MFYETAEKQFWIMSFPNPSFLAMLPGEHMIVIVMDSY